MTSFRFPRALAPFILVPLFVASSASLAGPITHERVGRGGLVPLLSERTLVPLGLEHARQEGDISAAQLARLAAELDDVYGIMEAAHGPFDSALARSLSDDESPNGFDIITIPSATRPPGEKRAAIFLHGYGGAFVLQCWLFAEAVRSDGVTTVCPATTWAGKWSDARGRGIVEATLKRLEADGFTDITLAGLSNGAVGAANLSAQFASRLKRLVLISGSSPRAAPGLPLLLLGSRDDPNVSYRRLARLGARRNGRIVQLSGDHFAFLFDRVLAQRAIGTFFGKHTLDVSEPRHPVRRARSHANNEPHLQN